MRRILIFLLFCAAPVMADPQLSSWRTADSGQYARIYQNTAAETARTASVTWSRGTGVQSSPTYAEISKIAYSANWVYIKSSGLAGHVMGPWYLNAAKTQDFPNFPANQARSYRIPRNPSIPASKTLTGLGATGCMVNGVAMFDMRDAFSYASASSTDATPVNGLTGDGVWNRDGYHNESVTFDPAFAHQAGSNYHYHAQPIALRHQLGDHVDYNPVTNRYVEKSGLPTRHSPIVGWAADGLPVYGPYGYSSPLNPASGVRRMVSGFVLRDGTKGTTNLAATGRTTLPPWAQRIQTVTFRNGPAVGATYLLGHYLEDFDYLGDHGFVHGVDFDLNEYNVRWCVTPEFPGGTYAYFTTIHANGSPAYPYTTGRHYFGAPTGGSSGIAEPVSVVFDGGPNGTAAMMKPVVNAGPGTLTLTWSAAEGGSYQVESSDNLQDWKAQGSEVLALGKSASLVDQLVQTGLKQRFYRVTRRSLAPFDSRGFDFAGGGGTQQTAPGGSAARGTTVVVTISLPPSPPNPPIGVLPVSVTLAGNIAGTTFSRPAVDQVQATFVIPANAPTGLQSIVVVFSPGPTYTIASAFTIQ
jgi:hypothetical protein